MALVKIPEHGYCFGCGKASKKGLNATFYLDTETGTVHTEYVYNIHHQGPPGYAHGGAIFTLLDETMGITAWVNGYSVVLRHIEVDYERAVPLGKRIKFEGKVERVEEDRKVFIVGRVYDEDGDYIRARGLYIHVEHDLFRHFRNILGRIEKDRGGV